MNVDGWTLVDGSQWMEVVDENLWTEVRWMEIYGRKSNGWKSVDGSPMNVRRKLVMAMQWTALHNVHELHNDGECNIAVRKVVRQ
jgi:hypothetical protein